MSSLKLLLYLILFSLSVNILSQNCILKGISPDYAGTQAPIFTIDNPVTGSRSFIDTVRFNEEGLFQISLPLSELTVLYFDLGRYEGYLYAEPDYEYYLIMPPYVKRSHYNNINPYYNPVEVHLKVSECQNVATQSVVQIDNELNTMLFRFDTIFSKANEKIYQYRQEQKLLDVDSIIIAIEQNYASDSSAFFKRYRKFRFGILKINEGKTGLEELSAKYLNERLPRIYEPAYMSLFNAMYDDFLMHYSRTDDGNLISTTINRNHSLPDLRRELGRHKAIFSDTIADLVILKEISQHYYKNYFIKDALLIILDSLASNSSVADYRRIAGEMLGNFSRLRIGNNPPYFNLRDQSGNYTSLDKFAGKYVYIYFCTPDNYSCMMEYPFLKSFHEKHHEYLEIVTVMIAESMEDMVRFMKQNNYDWTALFYDDQPGLLETYNIKYYPTSFLVGPDGKLVQSPATLPSEGFQQQLFKIMRSRGEI